MLVVFSTLLYFVIYVHCGFHCIVVSLNIVTLRLIHVVGTT